MTTARPLIGAVITAFQPPESLLEAIATVRPQVDAVVVVNDSPGAAGAVLGSAARAGAMVVEHPANLGIAAALNTGIAAVAAQLPGVAAVLTVDQDSRLPADHVAALLKTWDRARAAQIPVGMVAPSAAGNIGELPGTRAGRDGVLIGGEPIQSGLLIPTTTLELIGGFDESLFIDGVDSDFYLRALDAGLVSVVAPIAITHQLGRTVHVEWGPLRRDVTVAADHRYYYRVRNLVIVARRHARRHGRWVRRAIVKELRHQLITGLLVPGRRRRWGLAGRGLRDGLRGVGGRLAS